MLWININICMFMPTFAFVWKLFQLKKKINGNDRPQLDPEASSARVRASRPSQANVIDVVNAVKWTAQINTFSNSKPPKWEIILSKT